MRIGITVSRRVGKAVVRNRVKRRVREWFRSHRDSEGRILTTRRDRVISPIGEAGERRLRAEGVDLVVIARASAPAMNLPEMRCELSSLLARAVGQRALSRRKQRSQRA